jgi:hypothetical protein
MAGRIVKKSSSYCLLSLVFHLSFAHTSTLKTEALCFPESPTTFIRLNSSLVPEILHYAVVHSLYCRGISLREMKLSGRTGDRNIDSYTAYQEPYRNFYNYGCENLKSFWEYLTLINSWSHCSRKQQINSSMILMLCKQ